MDQNNCLEGLAKCLKTREEVTKQLKELQQSKSVGQDDDVEDIKELQEELEKIKIEESRLRRQVRHVLDQDVSHERQEDPDESVSEISLSFEKKPEDECNAFSTGSFGTKLDAPKFKRGEDFGAFCDDFLDHVKLARISDANLSLFFLTNVDAFTKNKLKDVTLTKDERRDPYRFTEIYKKKMTPRHEIESLQFKVIDAKQSIDESIEDFAHRLKQMASKALFAAKERNTICYSAFLKGLRNKDIRVKIRECRHVSTFEEAKDEAIRLHDILEEESSGSAPEQLEVLQIRNDGASDTNRNDRPHYNHRGNYRGRRGSTYRRHNNQSHHTRYQDHAHSTQQFNSPSTPSNNHSNFRGHRRGSTSSNPGSARRVIICHNCGQQNHIARHCTLNM